MPDPVLAMLDAGMVPTASLPPTSRYADVGTSTYLRQAAPGEETVPLPFIRRRLCPDPSRYGVLYEIAVDEGDRRDLLAHRHLGDPELWWRLADANRVIDPEQLTRPLGRRLMVTLPVDVQGAPDG
jgi:hypothetical protein